MLFKLPFLSITITILFVFNECISFFYLGGHFILHRTQRWPSRRHKYISISVVYCEFIVGEVSVVLFSWIIVIIISLPRIIQRRSKAPSTALNGLKCRSIFVIHKSPFPTNPKSNRQP